MEKEPGTLLRAVLLAAISGLVSGAIGPVVTLFTNIGETGIKLDLLLVIWLTIGFLAFIIVILLQMWRIQKRAERAYGRGISKGKNLKEPIFEEVWITIIDRKFKLTPENRTKEVVFHVPYDEEVYAVVEADQETNLYLLKGRENLKRLLADERFDYVGGGPDHTELMWRHKETSIVGREYCLCARLDYHKDSVISCSFCVRRMELRRIT